MTQTATKDEDRGILDPEFFPTPKNVISKMLAKINPDARYYLEPSAGRGDIAEAINDRDGYGYSRRGKDIDCIESSGDLCAILRDKEFSIVGFDWLTYDGVSYYGRNCNEPAIFAGCQASD